MLGPTRLFVRSQRFLSPVRRPPWRLLFVGAGLAWPTFVFILLGLSAPSQYQFVVVDASDRVWQLVFAIGILVVYALCALQSLRARDQLRPGLALLATSPVAALAITSIHFAGASPANLAAFAAAVGLAAVALILSRIREGRASSGVAGWSGPIVALAIYVGFALVTSLDPISLPRQVGSLAVLGIFCGTVSVVASVLILHPRLLAGSACYVLVALLVFDGNDHAIPETPSGRTPTNLEEAFKIWLTSRSDLAAYRSAGMAYPVFFVSSEGGGIYAAAHSYGLLSTLANHCPTFSQHTFALVGVSGGAIGNALFASGIDPEQHPAQPCGPGSKKVDPSPVLADHLSPPLARLLMVEVIDRLLPGSWSRRDRAQVLTDSFRAVARDPSYVGKAVSDSFDPEGGRPAVVSVAMDVATGRRLVMAPFQMDSLAGTARWWPGADLSDGQSAEGREVSLLDAAGASARFPWITPTGRLRLAEGREMTLADGGYFDNSGADTVLDLVTSLRIGDSWRRYVAAIDDSEPSADFSDCPNVVPVENFHEKAAWSDCSWPVFIVYLALASSEPYPDDGDVEPERLETQSFLFDPIRALLATRESRAEIALSRADLEMCGMAIGGAECYRAPGSSMGFFRNDVAPAKWKLPLGWYMSSASYDMLMEQTVPASTFDYRARREEANELQLALFHLDLGLYEVGAKPGLSDLMPGP